MGTDIKSDDSSTASSISGTYIITGIGGELTVDSSGWAVTEDSTTTFTGGGVWGVDGDDDGKVAELEEYLPYKKRTKEIINKNESILKMRKIKEVLEKVYSTDSLRKSVVPLFIGDPGLGKTVIIQEFAKEKGVNLVELITSQMSPFEISGIAMPDKDIKKMVYYNFDKLENLKDGDILFFDELLNGNPVVLNACLTILEQRKFISGKDLPNIMIIAAANPQGMTPLTPQIKERFIWYTVVFDKTMWIDFMVKKYKITRAIGQKLGTLIKKEEFLSNNFNTPRSIDKAVNMIIHEVPTPYEDIINPILSTIIKNPFKDKVHLPNGEKLMPDQMITWLDLIKLKFKK